MEKRTLGATGLRVSVLGFGCGEVGGLMVRGTVAQREQAVARALELGINYFDTAPLYGGGESEKNLGQALRRLRSDALIGTKVRLGSLDRRRVEASIVASLDASLRRLGREQVDLLQLHNQISMNPADDALDVNVVLDLVVPTFERLRTQGKIRAYGITALGETEALHKVIDSSTVGTAQVVYNLLNPSAACALHPGFPAQDFGNLLNRIRLAGKGALGIRVLAAGALGGSDARHPLGLKSVKPMGSGSDYDADLRRAGQLKALVRKGHVGSLAEAALRFASGNADLATTLIGISSLDQLEIAAAAINKGSLTPDACDLVNRVQAGFVGEPR